MVPLSEFRTIVILEAIVVRGVSFNYCTTKLGRKKNTRKREENGRNKTSIFPTNPHPSFVKGSAGFTYQKDYFKK